MLSQTLIKITDRRFNLLNTSRILVELGAKFVSDPNCRDENNVGTFQEDRSFLIYVPSLVLQPLP